MRVVGAWDEGYLNISHSRDAADGKHTCSSQPVKLGRLLKAI